MLSNFNTLIVSNMGARINCLLLGVVTLVTMPVSLTGMFTLFRLFHSSHKFTEVARLLI